jgi:hypothetical protein
VPTPNRCYSFKVQFEIHSKKHKYRDNQYLRGVRGDVCDDARRGGRCRLLGLGRRVGHLRPTHDDNSTFVVIVVVIVVVGECASAK